MWLDPVEHDLNLLGVKPADPKDYNIHVPPLPRGGIYMGRVFTEICHQNILNHDHIDHNILI